jgi:hypothetical protein
MVWCKLFVVSFEDELNLKMDVWTKSLEVSDIPEEREKPW